MEQSLKDYELLLGENGYMLDWQAWNLEIAHLLATHDGLSLEAEHIQVINILREYYDRYEISPPIRALIKILRRELEDDALGSRELYRLFPDGPAKQACRYAGLPRPVSCI